MSTQVKEQGDRDSSSICELKENPCKVGRALKENNIEHYNQTMMEKWNDPSCTDVGLREFRDHINRAIMGSWLEKAGIEYTKSKLNLYQKILKEDDDDPEKVNLKERFKRKGIDVKEMESSFVSHQAVSNHLRDCCGTEYVAKEKSREEKIDSALGYINKIGSRVERVTVDWIGKITDVDKDEVAVTINIEINTSEDSYSPREFFEKFG